jgi:hypothetical protein
MTRFRGGYAISPLETSFFIGREATQRHQTPNKTFNSSQAKNQLIRRPPIGR